MKFFPALSILLAALGGYSFPRYKSELLNYPNLSPQVVGEFEVYDIAEHYLQLSLNFMPQKLHLKITNNSEAITTFLPLDLNLGTEDNRCSIKEIYEDSPRKKVDFKTKYVLEKKTSKAFFYKFTCGKSPESFLTINGLRQENKKITLNFKFSKK